MTTFHIGKTTKNNVEHDNDINMDDYDRFTKYLTKNLFLIQIHSNNNNKKKKNLKKKEKWSFLIYSYLLIIFLDRVFL